MDNSVSIVIDGNNEEKETSNSENVLTTSEDNKSFSEVIRPIYATQLKRDDIYKSEGRNFKSERSKLTDRTNTKFDEVYIFDGENQTDTVLQKESQFESGSRSNIESESESNKNNTLTNPLHGDRDQSSILNESRTGNRHRCRTCDPEESEFLSRLGHDEARMNYNKGYSQLLFWILLLLSNWGLTRVICIGGNFPGDCAS